MKKETLTKEQCDAYLATVAEIKPWDSGHGEIIDAWYSKTDGSYLTFTSITTDIAWMAELGLTELQSTSPGGNTAQIGYHAPSNKWYGWSHRAVYGFGIGHEVKKGHAGYQPSSIDDFIEQRIAFWSDEDTKNVKAVPATNNKGEKGVQVTWDYITPHPLLGEKGGSFVYLGPEFSKGNWGKGEWTAETIDDAKQMAVDFARGVS